MRAGVPSPPSPWVTRHAQLIRAGGSVLDVACGGGRHLKWLSARGHRVTGVDRDAAALAPLGAHAEIVVADLEAAPWPLPGRRFDAVVVTNYLWRPLLPALLQSVADGGVLLYETFAVGQETIGKPSRADFLLYPGELLAACAGLRVVAYEDGFEPGFEGRAADAGLVGPPGRFVQRIAALREAAVQSPPARHVLAGASR